MSLLAARGVAAAVTLLTVPLTLGYLGPERYGVWMTLSSLISFLAFTDLGIGNGLLTAVAAAHGRGDRTALIRQTGTGFWLLAGVGVVLAGVVIAAYSAVDWAGLLNVRSSQAAAEAGPAVLAFSLCFALSLPLNAVSQIRLGLQEGYVSSLFTAAGNVLSLALILVVVSLQLGLPHLVLATMGAPLVASLLNGLWLVGHQRPWLRSAPRRVELATARRLLGSGSQFLLLQLAMAAAFYSDSLIAARVIGPTAVAEYAVTLRLFLIPTVLASAAVSPLWPAYGEAAGRGDVHWISRTLRRSIVIVLAITVPLTLMLGLASERLLELWIGDAVRPPVLLVAGMAAWTVLSAVGTAVAMFLNGLHMLRVQIITALVMASLNVALSIFLASRIGVAGVILGTVIAYPLSTLIPMAIYVPRVLRRLSSEANGRRESATIG